MNAPNTMLRTSALLRMVGALACDLAMAALGAYLLWSTGVITVADAPFQVVAMVIIITASLVVVRRALLSGDSPHRGTILLGIETSVLIAVSVLWAFTGNYYLGWQTTYCVLLLTVRLVFDLFGAGLTRMRASARRPTAKIAAVVTVIAIGAVCSTAVMTTHIHQWDPTMLNVVIGTVVVSFGLGTLAASLTRDRDRDRDRDRRDRAEPPTETHLESPVNGDSPESLTTLRRPRR